MNDKMKKAYQPLLLNAIHIARDSENDIVIYMSLAEFLEQQRLIRKTKKLHQRIVKKA